MESLTPFLVTNVLFGTIMVALRVRSRRLRASVVAQENEITEAAIAGAQPQQQQQQQQPTQPQSLQPRDGALNEAAAVKEDEGDASDSDTSAFIRIPSSKPDAWLHFPSKEISTAEDAGR